MSYTESIPEDFSEHFSTMKYYLKIKMAITFCRTKFNHMPPDLLMQFI